MRRRRRTFAAVALVSAAACCALATSDCAVAPINCPSNTTGKLW